MTAEKRKCVGGAVIYNGKILLMQRVPSREILPEFWEIPGGGVEENETYEEALKRELQEETGLKVDTIGEQYFWLEDGRHQEPHYLVPVDTSKITMEPTEHQAIKWIECKEDLDGLQMTPEMKKSILLALEKVSV